jgi:dynein heavy chain
MFLEGAKWDYKKHLMGISYPKELFSDLPPIHMVPAANRVIGEEVIYECPLYKVEIRKGSLSTTGHSTNFVKYIEIPTKEH